MAILGGLGVKLSMNLAEWSKNVKSVTKDINTIRNTVSGFKNAIIAGFALDQLASFGKSIFDVTAQFQTFESTLTNTLGSKSAAKQALEEVRKFATETPFAVAEVSSAYVRWANQGLSPTTDKLKKLGDVASALGGGFEQTAEAFKDLAVGQTKRIEELGILATQANGKIQLSFKGVNLEIEKNAGGVQKALDVYSQLPGVLGTTESVSKTLSGKLSNLKDTFDNLLLTIGNSKSGLIGGFLDFGINALNFINKQLDDNIGKVKDEQIEINALVGAITQQNISQETRKKLLTELNQKYPEFLKGLDGEKSTNEQLLKQLDLVNSAYIEKLALLSAENRFIQIREKSNKLIEEEGTLRKNLASAEQRALELKGKVTSQVLNGITIQKKADTDALGAIELLKSAIQRNAEEQKIATAEQIDALKLYTQKAKEFAAEAGKYFQATITKTGNEETGLTQLTKEEWDLRLKYYQDFNDKILAIDGDRYQKQLAKAFENLQKENKIRFELQGEPFKEIQKSIESTKIDRKPLIPVGIKIEPPNTKVFDALNQLADQSEKIGKTEDAINAINLSFKNAAEDGLAAFGNALGGVFTGQIKFGDAILIGLKKFLGTFAKLLIGFGTASDAFKKGFENPYVAIAAGIALSALAGAIGNLNNGGVGSSSSGVGGGFERMTSSGFSQNINVTGKLIGSGRDLVAVIGTTGFDNKYTKVP